MVAVKLRQSNRDRPLDETERNSFITQSNNTQDRSCGKTHEVSRVNLDLEQAAFAGGDGIAFDQRIIEPDRLPILVAVALQINFAADQTDASDASFDVIIVIRLIVVGAGG